MRNRVVRIESREQEARGGEEWTGSEDRHRNSWKKPTAPSAPVAATSPSPCPCPHPSIRPPGCAFSGTIPPSLSLYSSLRLLALGDRLSGSIPSSLGELTELRRLYLQGPQLEVETLPTELARQVKRKLMCLPLPRDLRLSSPGPDDQTLQCIS